MVLMNYFLNITTDIYGFDRESSRVSEMISHNFEINFQILQHDLDKQEIIFHGIEEFSQSASPKKKNKTNQMTRHWW